MSMKALKLLFLMCSMSVFAQIPANNECVNAEPITIPTATVLTISADFTEATESLDASCNIESADNKDLWYEFTMPIDGVLRISNTSVVNYFTVFDTCGGAEIECHKDDSTFINLINGNTYLLRASYQFNGVASFTFQALTLVVNDECVNRETISISTSNFTQPNPNSSFATESLIASCDTSNITHLDVWYEFIMPVNGNLEVTFANNRQTFALYDSCAGTELQCFSNIGLFRNLTQNTTYILRVAERSPDAGAMNFRLQAYEFAANDECVNSETILVETANSNTYQVDMRTATESLDAICETGSNDNYDLWYNFTMQVTGNIKIDQLSGLDTVTIYDNCGGNEISCQSGLQFVSGLIEGTNYTVRIASITSANKQPRFQAFPVAPNDECDNSETIIVETSNALSYQVDVRRGTESQDSSCDNADDNNLDLWYDFVMPVTGNIQISGVSFTFRTTLYDGCSGNELECFNGNGTYFNLGLSTSYKLRVSQVPNSANNFNFNIQAFENLFNDECATPQAMTIPTVDFATYSTNNAAATNSSISACEPLSDSFTIQDVWYRFTMPNDNDVEIDHLTTTVNGYYALYDSCGTTELQCINNDGFFTDLTGGNEYLLKVGKLSTQPGELSFNISAKSETLNSEELAKDTIIVYPNPVETTMYISVGNGTKIEEIFIYDMTGRLVKKILNPEFESQMNIDIADLLNAAYFMVVKSKDRQMMHRIIKK